MKTTRAYLIENQIIPVGSNVKLQKGKQVGILYHFTGNIGIVNIALTCGLKSHNNDYISFTRNFRLGTNEDFGEFRLTFDGDKLSDKYHIEPYLNVEFDIKRSAGEREERILWPKGKLLPITNRKFCLGIQVIASAWRQLTEEQKDNITTQFSDLSIPIQFVREFTLIKL
jgi:hypothetical protein